MAHRRQSHRKRKEIEPGALSDGSERGMCGRKRQTIFSSEQFEDIAGAVLAGKHGAVHIATKLPESTSWRKLCSANNIPVHYAHNLMYHTQNKVTAAVETAMEGRLEEVEKELAVAKHALVNMKRKLTRREKEAASALAAKQAANEEAISSKNAEIKELKAWRLATDFALMEEEELRNMEVAAAAGAGLSQQVSPMAYSCTTCSLFSSPLQCPMAYPSNARWLTHTSGGVEARPILRAREVHRPSANHRVQLAPARSGGQGDRRLHGGARPALWRQAGVRQPGALGRAERQDLPQISG